MYILHVLISRRNCNYLKKRLNNIDTYGCCVGANSFPGVFIVILNLVNKSEVVVYEKVRLNISKNKKNRILIECILGDGFNFTP
jgi:hypothetical protein